MWRTASCTRKKAQNPLFCHPCAALCRPSTSTKRTKRNTRFLSLPLLRLLQNHYLASGPASTRFYPGSTRLHPRPTKGPTKDPTKARGFELFLSRKLPFRSKNVPVLRPRHNLCSPPNTTEISSPSGVNHGSFVPMGALVLILNSENAVTPSGLYLL